MKHYYTITLEESLYPKSGTKHRLITILLKHNAESIIPATNVIFTFQSDEDFDTWKEILKLNVDGSFRYYIAEVISNEYDYTNYADTKELLANIEIIRDAQKMIKE